MRISISRKGFDSSAGGRPSPIVDGRPVSLPIPALRNSRTTYRDLGLGPLVEAVTAGRIGGDSLCHADPWFTNGRCAFGQTGAAQGHLRNQGFGVGDMFLFFGLFAEETSGERHHRIFGYMRVESIVHPGPRPDPRNAPDFAPDHPHFIGERDANNTLYLGPGAVAQTAPPMLRLTRPSGPPSVWSLPEWIGRHGLSYHAKPDRWLAPGLLRSAAKGQEFVCDTKGDVQAHAWIERVVSAIEAPR